MFGLQQIHMFLALAPPIDNNTRNNKETHRQSNNDQIPATLETLSPTLSFVRIIVRIPPPFFPPRFQIIFIPPPRNINLVSGTHIPPPIPTSEPI